MKKRNKLTLKHLLWEVENNGQDEQNQIPTQDPSMGNQDPQMAPQANAEVPPEETPSQVNSKAKPNKSALSDVVGSTISDIGFEPVGSNGGKITLRVSNSHVPLIISWAGSKVTATKPDGTVIMLSKEE